MNHCQTTLSHLRDTKSKKEKKKASLTSSTGEWLNKIGAGNELQALMTTNRLHHDSDVDTIKTMDDTVNRRRHITEMDKAEFIAISQTTNVKKEVDIEYIDTKKTKPVPLSFF